MIDLSLAKYPSDYKRNFDLPKYLQDNGVVVTPEGNSYRINGHSGLIIQIDKQCGGWRYYHFSNGKGGDCVDFLKSFFNMDFTKAMSVVESGEYAKQTECTHKACLPFLEEKKRDSDVWIEPQELPAHIMKWLQDGRGLNMHAIVTAKLGYLPAFKELPERLVIPNFSVPHKCGLWRCMQALPSGKRYIQRGAKCPYYVWGASNAIVITESCLDALLLWQASGYNLHVVALQGVTLLDGVEKLTGGKRVFLWLDNDSAGRASQDAILNSRPGWAGVRLKLSAGKDINEIRQTIGLSKLAQYINEKFFN